MMRLTLPADDLVDNRTQATDATGQTCYTTNSLNQYRTLSSHLTRLTYALNVTTAFLYI